MRFAIISPTAGLQRFSTLSTTHLLLAHVENPLYWKFYKKLSQDSKQILILDNSAYEGQMNMELALSRLDILRPTVFVLPDLLGGLANENFKLATRFLKTWRHRLPCDFMFIPQFDGSVNDFNTMRWQIKTMIEAFGVKWFGIPRLMAERGYSRAALCLWIKDQNFENGLGENYVHAMGMMNGNLREMHELNDAGCNSIDSSAPVWRGWQGYDIERSKEWAQHGMPCDFNVHPDTLTSENETLILSNLKKVGIHA